MKNNPLISVIVPVYNIGGYVGKCLRSLAEQSYNNIEILVVNDGSTDDSVDVCRKIAADDKRIRVLSKKNGGLSDARNYGIKKAHGDVIVLVDGDDFVKKDYILAMWNEMEKSGADIVVCGYNSELPAESVISGKDATIKLLTLQGNLDVVAWNKMYKKELFSENGIWYPFGLKFEDTLTTYKLFSKAEQVAYIHQSLYNYMVRSDSITSTSKAEESLDARRRAADDSVVYLASDSDMVQAAKIAAMTARFAYIDASIAGRINRKYFSDNREWLLKRRKELTCNKYIANKQRTYLKLLALPGGFAYRMFRKIIK